MRSQDGFSLLEVCFVLAIALVLSAISIPNMAAVVSNARLHAGVSSISGLLQNGRMIAVKKNKAMSVHFEAEDASIVGYVKEVLDTSERTGSDMQAQWEDPVSMMMAPAGDDAPDPLSTTVLGFTPEESIPSFNSRGLPCAYSSGICPNRGFVYYFKDTSRPDGQGWAALSITPAGRIARWFWHSGQWVS